MIEGIIWWAKSPPYRLEELISFDSDNMECNYLEVNFDSRYILVGVLVFIIGVAVLSILGPGGCGDSASYPPSTESQKHVIAGAESEFISADFANLGITLFLTGNWGGQLGPCGCSERQLGGIDRRTHILNAVSDSRRLLLDAGPLIKGEGVQAQLKLETFMRSLRHLRYDAITLTAAEIIILQKDLSLGPDERPVIIVSNMPPEVRQEYGVAAYLEKTLRRGDEILDCLVLALLDPQSPAGLWGGQELQLQDPITSFIETLTTQNIDPYQSPNDKFVVVLLPDDNEFLAQQIKQIPALDLLVRVGYGDMPELIDNSNNAPMVVTTGKLGKYVTKIEFPAGAPAEGKNARFEPVPVEEHFPRDPNIVGIFNDYQLFLKDFNLIDSTYLPRLALVDDNAFTGSQDCADCHMDIYLIWQQFGHAHALETLIKENRPYDPECVKCHTIGMEYEIGYRSMEKTPHLADVGCEMCHGPGMKHRLNTHTMYQDWYLDGNMTCEKCHTHENSPNFEGQREEYFQKIKHWPEPRIYWK